MYKLPELNYKYDALAPAISADIMELHHAKHHQTYVDKLNAAIEQEPSLEGRSLVDMLTGLDSVPEKVRGAVRNHGGGHYNHSLFWKLMSPDGGGKPGGELGSAIDSKWGGFDKFVDEFNDAALKLFGSGWVWLNADLEIVPTANQDTTMALGKGEPLMGLDVWEHAYYLDYKNKRDEYIKSWWQVVNWEFIEKRYRGE